MEGYGAPIITIIIKRCELDKHIWRHPCIYVSYNITWDVLFGGGVVGAYIESSTSLVYLSVQSTLFTSAYTSTSASGVIVLAAGASIACWANNLTGTNLSIIGAGNLVVNSCQMSCYILN